MSDTTPTDLQALEEALLRDPFDDVVRRTYAAGLFAAASWQKSLEQWDLIGRRNSEDAMVHLHKACCHRQLGDGGKAEEHLEHARRCPNYDPREPDQATLIEGNTPGGEPPSAHMETAAHGLRVLAGGARQDAELVSITSSPTVRFADIIGMDELKKTIRLRIIAPFANPGLFARFKKQSGGGVLLYGPPGCGKTMMARAIATECKASFTSVGISDILNLWQGESERNLAGLFSKAREDAPAVLFFDELDALAFSRSKARSENTRTLVNEFLAQLDGMAGDNAKVLIVGATNMPWDVDDAMKRPGRFDRQVFVPPPDAPARAEMFRIKLVGVPLEPSVDYAALGKATERFSGADIDGVIDRAKDTTLDAILQDGLERELTQNDLVEAVRDSEPSTVEWLRTARNLVKFGGAGSRYKDVEAYLRAVKMY